MRRFGEHCALNSPTALTYGKVVRALFKADKPARRIVDSLRICGAWARRHRERRLSVRLVRFPSQVCRMRAHLTRFRLLLIILKEIDKMADVLDLLYADNSSATNNEFTSFKSGSKFYVKVLGDRDIKPFYSYGIFNVVNSFVPEKQDRKSVV